MIKQTTEEIRQMLDLENLQLTLLEENFRTELIPKDKNNHFSFLAVHSESKTFMQPIQFQLLYLPTANLLKETNLLRFYFTFPIDTNGKQLELSKLMDYYNQILPLGSFNFDEDSEIYFKYIYTLPRFSAPEKKQFLEVVYLFLNIIEEYGAKLIE